MGPFNALCLLLLPAIAVSAEWRYDGWSVPASSPFPAAWGDVNQVCLAGTEQSPIDIKDVKYKCFGNPLNLNNLKTSKSLDIVNNGHTIKASDPSPSLVVNGGGLTGDYIFQQFHLHWGSDNTDGSEHLIDGKAFPAEIHFVLKNDLDEYAVVGMMIEVGDANAGLQGVLDEVANLNDPATAAISADVDIREIVPTGSLEFYRYEGSFTTPPCTEAVAWTLLTEPISMSTDQFTTLRTGLLAVTGETQIVAGNFRPVQSLNHRTVYVSDPIKDTSISGSRMLTASWGLLFALLALF